MTQNILSDRDLDVIFREARSYKGWQDTPVSEITIRAMYDLLRWGPTSRNSCPGRFIIAKSPDAIKKLAACAWDGNKDKILTAPFTVVVAQDDHFYEKMPLLSKGFDPVKNSFTDKKVLAQETAFRNSSLQGAYMMIAARALGLDCCPISGFDGTAVKKAFFPDRFWTANFICSMGYGDSESLSPRGGRLTFDEACEIR